MIKSISGGVNQSGVRNYNERLLLSILQRNGSMPGRDLALATGLSPQTISVILRKLEGDGLLERGNPVRGKVGKPSIPMRLAAEGVFSIGLKVGRRSADLVLVDLHGSVRRQLKTTYRYPLPHVVFDFLQAGLQTITADLTPDQIARICGIGIAAPLEIWNWHETVGAPESELSAWKEVDYAVEVARFSALPVSIINDATAACQAEHIYGRGREFRDYAYFYVGAFIGGGVVLNHSVYDGHQRNAGALGSLRSIGPDGTTRQLIDCASIYLLEHDLKQAGYDPLRLWNPAQDWTEFADLVDPWIEQTALEIAKASLSTCAVIDFEAILIDGAFPEAVKTTLVDKVRAHIKTQDIRGLIPPRIENGVIGVNARAVGAACRPIITRFLLNTNVGISLDAPVIG